MERMGDSQTISLVGDYAKGIDNGKIEIMICGRQFNHDCLIGLSKKIEDQIDRFLTTSVSKKVPKEGIILYE